MRTNSTLFLILLFSQLVMGQGWHSMGHLRGATDWSGDKAWVWCTAKSPDGKLFAGGEFDYISGKNLRGLACWENGEWQSVGVTSGSPRDLVFTNDGRLIVGGALTADGQSGNVSVWNGSSWYVHDISVGPQGFVEAVAIDSSGNIWAGGSFTQVGSNTNIDYLAVFDGISWKAVGGGVNDRIRDIEVAPNGDVYVLGDFTIVSGNPVYKIAKWDGSSWSDLENGLVGSVRDMEFGDNGDLYVCGDMTQAGFTSVNGFARWDGSAWHQVGTNMLSTGTYHDLEIDGSDMYLSGQINTVASSGIVKWNGSTWEDLNTEYWFTSPYVVSITSMDSGIVIGGFFEVFGGDTVNSLSFYDPQLQEWSAWGNIGVNGEVTAIAVNDSDHVYVSGHFNLADNKPANRIAKWDGEKWSTLGHGLNGPAHELKFDSVGNLYAVGSFTEADSIPVNYIAKWDGTKWDSLGPGLPDTANTMAFHPQTGEVYVGGKFEAPTGLSHQWDWMTLGVWDGNSWDGLDIIIEKSTSEVFDLEFDPQNRLVAGATGYMTHTNLGCNNQAGYLIYTFGSGWSCIHSGSTPGLSYPPRFKKVLPVTNQTVYVGGEFTTQVVSQAKTRNVFKHDGFGHIVLSKGTNAPVQDMILDDNQGVYIAGYFDETYDSIPMNYMTYWDGTDLRQLNGGTNDHTNCLAMNSSGELYVGGRFTRADGKSSTFLAKWNGAPNIAAIEESNHLLNSSPVTLYPNPTSSVLNYKCDELVEQLFVIDLQGKVVFTQQTNTNTGSIEISQWKPGVYFVMTLVDAAYHRQQVVVQ